MYVSSFGIGNIGRLCLLLGASLFVVCWIVELCICWWRDDVHLGVGGWGVCCVCSLCAFVYVEEVVISMSGV